MVAQIDLSGELSGIPDNIVVFGLKREVDNISFFDIPEDYYPDKYDYIPSVSGVYDPNGFVLKPVTQPMNIEERIAYLETLIQSQNNS